MKARILDCRLLLSFDIEKGLVISRKMALGGFCVFFLSYSFVQIVFRDRGDLK